jgi:hypothetical protein
VSDRVVLPKQIASLCHMFVTSGDSPFLGNMMGAAPPRPVSRSTSSISSPGSHSTVENDDQVSTLLFFSRLWRLGYVLRGVGGFPPFHNRFPVRFRGNCRCISATLKQQDSRLPLAIMVIVFTYRFSNLLAANPMVVSAPLIRDLVS